MSETDKTLTTTSIFADVSGTKEKAKLNRDIVDYATADAETKARMDDLIATLKIDDLNSVTTFAKEPSETLGDVADGIIKEIQSSNSFLAPFEDFKKAIAEFDFETVGDMAKQYSAAVSRKLQLAKHNGLVRGFLGLFSRGKGASMDEIRSEIDKSLLQLGEVMASLEEASDRIPSIVGRLDELKTSFTHAYSEYGVYIGAALEKLREMEEETIPELQKEAQAGSLLKQEELQSSYMVMTMLNKKITNMDNFHKQSILNLARIRDLMNAMGMSKLNIDEKLTVSEGEWKGILATNAVAAEVSEIVDTVSDADQFSRQIREQGVKVGGMIQQKVAEAFEAGSVDAERMVELLKGKAQDLNKEAEYLAKFNQQQKDARAALDAAGRELLTAASSLHVPLNDAEVAKVTEEVKLLTYQPELVMPAVVAKEPVAVAVKKDEPKPKL